MVSFCKSLLIPFWPSPSFYNLFIGWLFFDRLHSAKHNQPLVAHFNKSEWQKAEWKKTYL
jgi:hypothetical protein